MAINSKSEYLSRNDSNALTNTNSVHDSPRVAVNRKYPNSSVSQSAGSLIIHLHKQDQPDQHTHTSNLNLIKEKETEEDIDYKLDKHFPIKGKEYNKENRDVDDSPRKKDQASKKIANFIKNSIEKKLQ